MPNLQRMYNFWIFLTLTMMTLSTSAILGSSLWNINAVEEDKRNAIKTVIDQSITQSKNDIAEEIYLNLQSLSLREEIINKLILGQGKVRLSYISDNKITSSSKWTKDESSLMQKKIPLFFAGINLGTLSIDIVFEEKSLIRENITLIALSTALILLMSIFTLFLMSWARKNIISKLITNVEKAAENRAILNVTRQMAHDIRSPLTVLSSSLTDATFATNESRKIVYCALNRIHDISNNLLSRGKKNNTNIEKTNSPISLYIREIASEKRTEYRTRHDLDIDFPFTQEIYGIFAKVDKLEFQRMLSNILNNAVEAIDGAGRVEITLFRSGKIVTIQVIDNGKGIPETILPHIFNPGQSYEKMNGNGLGLSHAKQVIQDWGGEINIESETGRGTIVTIKIPEMPPPNYFARNIPIYHESNIIIVDDENGIHQLWSQRFKDIESEFFHINLIHFQTPDSFLNWYTHNVEVKKIILIDYEFTECNITGLDIIKQINSSDQIYLITSRAEEIEIINQCKELKIKLIDKTMAGIVPLNACQNISKFVLIDDDSLIHMSWNRSANKAKIDFKAYFSPDEFEKDLSLYNKDTTIYIDSNLGNGIKGEVYAKKLYHLGFTNLYIATGYDPKDFTNLNFIKGVVSKRPIWKV